MTIASLRYLEDPDRRETFDYAHYQDHLAIAQAIRAQLGTTIEVPPISPVGDDRVAWAQTHQRLHDDMNRALATEGEDLTADPFSSDWVSQNYFEHSNVRQVLGI